ncbi:hypothetical protein [Persicobacter psychrovividus]|uniref:Heme exporter protein D n=1 Tax=Persicobacter psychrovividus TaxID=387638 RepID=A0ABM7VFL3_9BACT|nr:hypothetical protein PEPS_19390 [Persicobacter psychrovividus]
MFFFGLRAADYALHFLEYFDYIWIGMTFVFVIYLLAAGATISAFFRKNKEIKALKKENTSLKAKMFDLHEENKEQTEQLKLKRENPPAPPLEE